MSWHEVAERPENVNKRSRGEGAMELIKVHVIDPMESKLVIYSFR